MQSYAKLQALERQQLLQELEHQLLPQVTNDEAAGSPSNMAEVDLLVNLLPCNC
jgi:hypothetical protein